MDDHHRSPHLSAAPSLSEASIPSTTQSSLISTPPDTWAFPEVPADAEPKPAYTTATGVGLGLFTDDHHGRTLLGMGDDQRRAIPLGQPEEETNGHGTQQYGHLHEPQQDQTFGGSAYYAFDEADRFLSQLGQHPEHQAASSSDSIQALSLDDHTHQVDHSHQHSFQHQNLYHYYQHSIDQHGSTEHFFDQHVNSESSLQDEQGLTYPTPPPLHPDPPETILPADSLLVSPFHFPPYDGTHTTHTGSSHPPAVSALSGALGDNQQYYVAAHASSSAGQVAHGEQHPQSSSHAPPEGATTSQPNAVQGYPVSFLTPAWSYPAFDASFLWPAGAAQVFTGYVPASAYAAGTPSTAGTYGAPSYAGQWASGDLPAAQQQHPAPAVLPYPQLSLPASSQSAATAKPHAQAPANAELQLYDLATGLPVAGLPGAKNAYQPCAPQAWSAGPHPTHEGGQQRQPAAQQEQARQHQHHQHQHQHQHARQQIDRYASEHQSRQGALHEREERNYAQLVAGTSHRADARVADARAATTGSGPGAGPDEPRRMSSERQPRDAQGRFLPPAPPGQRAGVAEVQRVPGREVEAPVARKRAEEREQRSNLDAAGDFPPDEETFAQWTTIHLSSPAPQPAARSPSKRRVRVDAHGSPAWGSAPASAEGHTCLVCYGRFSGVAALDTHYAEHRAEKGLRYPRLHDAKEGPDAANPQQSPTAMRTPQQRVARTQSGAGGSTRKRRATEHEPGRDVLEDVDRNTPKKRRRGASGMVATPVSASANGAQNRPAPGEAMTMTPQHTLYPFSPSPVGRDGRAGRADAPRLRGAMGSPSRVGAIRERGPPVGSADKDGSRMRTRSGRGIGRRP